MFSSTPVGVVAALLTVYVGFMAALFVDVLGWSPWFWPVCAVLLGVALGHLGYWSLRWVTRKEGRS